MTVPHPRAQRVVLLAEPRPPGPPGGPHSNPSEKGARMTTVPQRKQMETRRELTQTLGTASLSSRGEFWDFSSKYLTNLSFRVLVNASVF